MPLTLTSAMNLAVRSLQTTQAALGTVSHNIANTDTPGFTRQQVMMHNVSLDGFGAGSGISEIRRVANGLIDADLVERRSSLGYAETYKTYLGNLETVFGVPGASSSTERLITKMFNDISTVAGSPDSSSLKLNVINDARFLIDTLHTIDSQLNDTALRADEQINNEIIAINEAIKNIHDLNQRIGSFSSGNDANGSNANDLMDERQRQIDIIAERINVNIIYGENDSISLVTETGRRLVDEGYVQLERIPSSGSYAGIGVRTITSAGRPSNSVLDIEIDEMTDGSIKALVDVRDTQVSNFRSEINELATTLRDEINRIHSRGTGIPPQNSFTTGNGFKLSGSSADVTSELGINAGDSFEISIVDIRTGQPIATTAATTVSPPTPGGGGPIVVGAGNSLADIAANIQGNADVGGLLTSTTVVDANGDVQMRISANNPNYAVVMKNNTGDVLGELGVNNFFVGETTAELEIRSDIASNPSLFATAQMRDSDGGVSFVDNRNATQIAELSKKKVSFDGAGAIASKEDTLSGYYVGISSNMAVNLRDAEDRLDFTQTVYNDVEARRAEMSGVNMDEELSSLITYQRTYQASARIISVVDEMLTTLVNLV